jgi:hypothetical protein
MAQAPRTVVAQAGGPVAARGVRSESGYVAKYFQRAAKVRAPMEREADFARLFDVTKSAKGATTAMAAAKSLAGPIPDDLGESDEVTLTPSIRALADSLGHSPVNVYQWVRNNVEFVPTYGAIHAAASTLELKRGNAFDIASLTIALLRASGIPARYAYGTIEVPATVMGNWVGGSTNATGTAALLAQGGIPSSTVVAGGQVSTIHMEHVWVEAYVNYVPPRAAVAGAPTMWIPLDAAYKVNTFTAGVSGAALGGFEFGHAGATANQGATTDAAAQHLNSTPRERIFDPSVAALQTAIAGTLPNTDGGRRSRLALDHGRSNLRSSRHASVQDDRPAPLLGGALDNFRWKIRYDYASTVDLRKARRSSLWCSVRPPPRATR